MGRRQGAPEERRTAILDAAEAVFTEHGYQGASIREIARRAEVSSALLYWFFPKGKAETFAQVLLRRADAQEVLTFPPGALDLPPEFLLPRLAQGFVTLMSQPQQVGMMKLLLHESDHNPELIGVLREAILQRALQPLQAYFARQQELGRIRPLPLVYVTQAFISLFLGLILRREILQEPESRAWPVADYATTAVAIFLQGLALPPGAESASAPPLEIPAPLSAPPTTDRRATRIPLEADGT